MTFEQALAKASEEYLIRIKNGTSAAEIGALMNEIFPILSVHGDGRKYHLTMPAPGLWEKRHGNDSSIYWTDDSDVVIGNIQKRLQKYPQGSGLDGIVSLQFSSVENIANRDDIFGDGMHPYVEISFQPYLPIPKNKIVRQGLAIPIGEYAEKLTDLTWVYDERGGVSPEQLTNWSDYGRIRNVWSEGFSRFLRRSTSADVKPEEIQELILTIPGEGREVSSITPRIKTGKTGEDNYYRFNGAPLGDGSVDAFLRHMDYTQLDSIVR